MILLFHAVSTCFTIFRLVLVPLVFNLAFSHFQLVQRLYLFPPLQSISPCFQSVQMYTIYFVLNSSRSQENITGKRFEKSPNTMEWSPGERQKQIYFLRALRGRSRQGAYTYPAFFCPALAHSIRSRDLACNTALGRKIIRNKKLKRLWTNYVSLSSFAITFIILIDWVSYVWQINVWFFRCSWFKYTLNWV